MNDMKFLKIASKNDIKFLCNSDNNPYTKLIKRESTKIGAHHLTHCLIWTQTQLLQILEDHFAKPLHSNYYVWLPNFHFMKSVVGKPDDIWNNFELCTFTFSSMNLTDSNLNEQQQLFLAIKTENNN